MEQETPRGLLLRPPMTYRPVSAVPFVPVSETAITLKLPPVPPRRRFEAWPVVAAAGVAAIAIGVMIQGRPPRPVPAPAAQRPIATVGASVTQPIHPRIEVQGEPVLASAANVTSSFEVDESESEIEILEEDELDEIVIIDEPEPAPAPAPKASPATRRERARSAARSHMKKAQAAQSIGDNNSAAKGYQAALAALPSYAPAAAALAELNMKRRKYKLALRYARRASTAAPRKLEYMLLLGDAYFLTKNRKAARKVWRKAAAYGSAKAKSRLGT